MGESRSARSKLLVTVAATVAVTVMMTMDKKAGRRAFHKFVQGVKVVVEHMPDRYTMQMLLWAAMDRWAARRP